MPLSRLGEKILIETALKHTGGRKGEAAELLGWGRNTRSPQRAGKLKTLLPEMAED
ncbi:helix-turn-helix domain-containing protein [Halomonas maura]|uniref:helix-turn-helix domain-containing protein n=1 Tax=Halomonas maura TaxID=117606 RepID=UPI0025B619C1|nr:helix-turn-helix domain-containing protein [Halomonas maura]MDN3555753.1 helix-turn-helix domain-containing protein [Halomonas maura]